MSAEPPANPPEDDAERGDTPRVQLHNVIARVRHQFARTPVIQRSRRYNRKAASLADSEVALEQDVVVGPSRQPDPRPSPPAPRPLPLAEHLLVPADHTIISTIEANVDEPRVEEYLWPEIMPEMADQRTPRYVY
jgi:hypothetical protein